MTLTMPVMVLSCLSLWRYLWQLLIHLVEWEALVLRDLLIKPKIQHFQGLLSKPTQSVKVLIPDFKVTKSFIYNDRVL